MGIRLVHTLMRDESHLAQAGGILKYTRPAVAWRNAWRQTHLMKKPGYYLSEEAYIARCVKNLIWRFTVVFH